MVKKIVLVFAMIATVIGLWASIERKDEKGMMPEFEKIVVNASIRLSIVHGDSLSVRIHGDNDDVYDFIDCKVMDNSLVITSNDDEYVRQNNVRIRVVAPYSEEPIVKAGDGFSIIGEKRREECCK